MMRIVVILSFVGVVAGFTACISRRSSSTVLFAAQSPLDAYNEWIDHKLAYADQKAVLVENDAKNLNEDSVNVYDFDDIMWMAFASATSSDMDDKRQRFADKMSQNGGYCIVKLQEPEVTTINNLWDCMEDTFSVKEKSDADFRHQTLTRENTAIAHQNSGYEFFQTSLTDSSLSNLAQLTSQDTADKALNANYMLSLLGKAVASILYAGVYGCSPKEASTLTTSLLDEEGKPFSGSFHRLAKYVPVKGDTDSPYSESLRSHGDWSLTTPIPVSSIAGLQIYNSQLKKWVYPETQARCIYEQTGGSEVNNSDSRWYSRYIVVMTGKWIELLTNGKVETCIHRVVSSKDAESTRMSAPLFMRPKAAVFEQAEAIRFDHGDTSETEAVAKLCLQLTNNNVTPGLEKVSGMAVAMVEKGRMMTK